MFSLIQLIGLRVQKTHTYMPIFRKFIHYFDLRVYYKSPTRWYFLGRFYISIQEQLMLHSLFCGFAFASVFAATARLQYIADHRVNVVPNNAISFNGLRVAKPHRQNHLNAAAQHCLLDWFPITA